MDRDQQRVIKQIQVNDSIVIWIAIYSRIIFRPFYTTINLIVCLIRSALPMLKKDDYRSTTGIRCFLITYPRIYRYNIMENLEVGHLRYCGIFPMITSTTQCNRKDRNILANTLENNFHLGPVPTIRKTVITSFVVGYMINDFLIFSDEKLLIGFMLIRFNM